MQTLLKFIIINGYQNFGKFKLLNKFIISIYRYIIIPLVFIYLKIKHSNLIKIQIRNSASKELSQSFNFLLSDLDSSLIIKDNFDPTELVKDFLKIKKVLIFLDYPEIYFQNEYNKICELRQVKTWEVVDFFWNIRKINWCIKKLNNNNEKINKIKMNRAIGITLSKLLKESSNKLKARYFLNEFKIIDLVFETKKENITVCYYSSYLGTDKSSSIHLELSNVEYLSLNSLMPGDYIDESIVGNLNSFYLESKIAITEYELLITKSSIRLKRAMNEDVQKLVDWDDFLANQLAEKLFF